MLLDDSPHASSSSIEKPSKYLKLRRGYPVPKGTVPNFAYHVLMQRLLKDAGYKNLNAVQDELIARDVRHSKVNFAHLEDDGFFDCHVYDGLVWLLREHDLENPDQMPDFGIDYVTTSAGVGYLHSGDIWNMRKDAGVIIKEEPKRLFLVMEEYLRRGTPKKKK